MSLSQMFWNWNFMNLHKPTMPMATRKASPEAFEQAMKEAYLKRPEQEWDGETPLYSSANDLYFYDIESLSEYVDDEDVLVEDMRLVICKPITLELIDANYWLDALSEAVQALPPGVMRAIDKLNDELNAAGPVDWVPGKYRACSFSVLYYFDEGDLCNTN